MEKEQLEQLRKNFKTMHKAMLGFFIAFNIIIFFVFGDTGYLNEQYMATLIIGIFGLIVIKIVNDSDKVVDSNFKLGAIYFEMFLFSGLALYANFSLMGMIFIIITILLMFEMSYAVDLTDDLLKVFQLGILAGGYLIEYIVVVSISNVSGNEVLMGILLFLFLVATYTIILFNEGVILKHYDEKIFSQARLLEEVNTTNDQLVDNQEKINRTNEQLGIQKVKLQAAYNKINRINSEMIILNDIIKCINESLDINKLIELIADSIINDLEIDVCAFRIDKDVVHNDNEITYVRSKYSQNFIDAFTRFVVDGKFPDEADVSVEYVDNQVDSANYGNMNTNLIGSLLMIPLSNENGSIGRIYAGYSKYNYFGENISFYKSIVAQFLMGIKNIQLFAAMEDMAIRDALTGIYNRRQLNKMVNECIKRIKENNTSLTSVLLDIDKFKNINDSYGHLFGDKVIKGIAQTITEVSKKNNHIIAARYGGEEFVIVFDNIPFDEVCDKVKKLHEEIKAKVFDYNGELIHVNVSIGISSYPQTCDNPEAVLNRSDWAMYYSKQNGRGRITIDNPEVDKLRK